MIDDYLPGATITKFFTTTAATTAPTLFAGSPAIAVLKDGTLTPSTAGVTLTVNVDTGGGAVTGLNRLQIDTAADTNFYSSGVGGSKFTAFVTAGTVDGVSRVGYVVYEFRLGALIPYDLPNRTDHLAHDAKSDTIIADVGALPTAAQNADGLLNRNIAGGSDGGRTVRSALRRLRNRIAIAAGIMTVYQEDDATPDHTATVTTTPGDPISQVDPT